MAKEKEAERKEKKAERKEKIFLAEEQQEQKILKQKVDAELAVSTAVAARKFFCILLF